MLDLGVMHDSWKPILEPVLREVRLDECTSGGEFLPPAPEVFRAFAIAHDAVRVLLVGQDPYPTPGHAMGLAFSTRPGVQPPRSLVNIYQELQADVGVVPRADGDLSAWEQQGVMLLNRVLTVSPGVAGSHRGRGWEAVTEVVIRSLNRSPLVAILWGNDARRCAAFLSDVPIIESAHPSPLSARRGFFGSRPFSRANELLVAQGAAPVDWRL